VNVKSDSIPVVDIAPLESTTDSGTAPVADAIHRACRDCGFFYVVGHGVSEELQQRLETLSHEFFALDLDKKMAIRMELGGRAWRGYFPVGAELTLDKPDQKEGLYFGAELDANHPAVKAGRLLHGRNLFPDIPGFGDTVIEYLDALTAVGHRIVKGIALSLGLDSGYMDAHYTRDPLILFRIFHYPPLGRKAADSTELWSVGEHTDYGLLTILRQDVTGGLQVKSRSSWMDAPPVPGAFMCNIGDMLDRVTGGLYRSTPHRVRNTSERSRLSFPFFFDPAWDAEVRPIRTEQSVVDDRQDRWDRASVHELGGTYGEYLLRKVGKVFPDLGESVL
jgi:isopenicillin N synthase-like dioxygenase